MKGAFWKTALVFAIILLLYGNANAENLGMYGLNMNKNLYETLDTAIEKGFRIKVYGFNLIPNYAMRLFQLSYHWEIANDTGLDRHFENEHSLYRIITDTDEIKYAKGFSVYNFLNNKGERIGSFIFDDNLNFIKKNDYGINIIPVKLYKENITIDMIFYNINKDIYKPLFFAVSFFKIESVQLAVAKLNKRFGNFKDIGGKNISARYWEKDGVSVANYFGLNDRFVFYKIDGIIEYNKQERAALEKINSKVAANGNSNNAALQKLHEDM